MTLNCIWHWGSTSKAMRCVATTLYCHNPLLQSILALSVCAFFGRLYRTNRSVYDDVLNNFEQCKYIGS